MQSELLQVLGEASGDPDVDVPRWLAGHTPLGIDKLITPRSIFPEVVPGNAEQDLAALLAVGNYSS